MVQWINFWRLLAAFVVGTIINLSWQDQIGQRSDGTAMLGWVGLGANLGFFVFGVTLVALSLVGYNLPASKWPLSLAGLLAIHIVGSPTALYLDSTAAILLNSALLTLFHTAFFAQLTAAAIDNSDFSRTRRGGTIGYGIAFAVASCRWPELSYGLLVVATVGLLGLQMPGRTLLQQVLEDPPAPPVLDLSPRQRWLRFIPLLILFATLGACARVYDSFGPASLMGTGVGLVAIGSLLLIEVVVLPLTRRLPGLFWVVAAIVGWLAAYSTLWLGSPWLIFGVSLVSINCCGQVILQGRAQQLSQRGSANLQAVMTIGSATAAGLVSALAVPWSRDGQSAVWILGLLTSLAGGIIVCVTLGVLATSHRSQAAQPTSH